MYPPLPMMPVLASHHVGMERHANHTHDPSKFPAISPIFRKNVAGTMSSREKTFASISPPHHTSHTQGGQGRKGTPSENPPPPCGHKGWSFEWGLYGFRSLNVLKSLHLDLSFKLTLYKQSRLH